VYGAFTAQYNRHLSNLGGRLLERSNDWVMCSGCARTVVDAVDYVKQNTDLDLMYIPIELVQRRASWEIDRLIDGLACIAKELAVHRNGPWIVVDRRLDELIPFFAKKYGVTTVTGRLHTIVHDRWRARAR